MAEEFNPITNQEKLASIASINKKFHRKGELLLPDDEFYPEEFDSKSLETAGKKICVWLGIKPTDLSFHVDNSSRSSLLKSDGKYHINIAGDYAKIPFVGSALLAKLCVQYAFSKKNLSTYPEQVEQATIELGLGLLIINAVNSDESIVSRLNRTLPFNKANIDSNILSYYSIREYVRLFTVYANHNELDVRVVSEHLLIWSRRSLPKDFTPTTKFSNENYVRETSSKLRTSHLRLVGICIVIMSVMTLSGFVWINRPKRLSTELQSQKESIEILESSFAKCTESLKQKKLTYNTDDFFMIRQLDANATRCTSIQNKHDYLVKDFNQKLEKAGLL